MKNYTLRLLAAAVALLTVLTFVALPVFAEETNIPADTTTPPTEEVPPEEPATSGTIGKNITWALEEDTLNVTGKGSITMASGLAPWSEITDRIKKLVIGEGITSVGVSTFDSLSELESISFPSTLETINSYAFQSCNKLRAVHLPKSLSLIQASAFRSCYALEKITVEEGNETYTAKNNCLIEKKTVVLGCKASVIPDDGSITAIGSDAFNGCIALKEMILPAGVAFIGNDTFNGCVNLKTVILPDSLNAIGARAFKYCTSLEKIVIPNGVEELANDTFSGCTSLKNITLPPTLTVLGLDLFYGCRALTEITIPASVSVMSNDVFRECSSLVKVTFLGAPPETIGERMFPDNEGFVICYNKEAEGWTTPDWNGYKTEAVEIKDTDPDPVPGPGIDQDETGGESTRAESKIRFDSGKNSKGAAKATIFAIIGIVAAALVVAVGLIAVMIKKRTQK